MKSSYCLIVLICLLFSACSDQKRTVVVSPDGSNKLTIIPERDTEYPGFMFESGSRTVLLPSSLNLDIQEIAGKGVFRIVKIESESSSNKWINHFGEKKDIPDNYNQAKVVMKKGNFRVNLIFRAYNEGVALAYEFPEQAGPDSVTIIDERTIFRFESDYMTWSAPRAQAQYSHLPLSQIDSGCERPLVVEIDSNLTVALAEARLVDYARMKFEPDTTSGTGIRTRLEGTVKKGIPFQSPWRVIITGKDAGDLLENNYLLLNLNDPSEIDDISWIRPGKALREVTLTTEGAIAAIDFTSAHNMQYVEFDAGWYGPENSDASDARAVNPDPARSKGPLDLESVIKYAKSKDIGILLYVNRKALEKQLEELLPIYSEWGVAGIKFGFVRVGDQDATRWLHESIKKLAAFNMVADVHDEYRPTGFSRTYPNFLTMEGIRGDEESPSNQHTLITMFTRMLAGQGDNTICYFNERVEKKMGSHASQLAKAVCLFSPLQFLYWYDKAAPSIVKNDGLWGATNYIGDEPELRFFDNVPTVWDDTKVLHARISEYGVIARKKDKEWFIGAINGNNPTTLLIDFSFLDPELKYLATIFSDDPLIDTRTHVRIDSLNIDRNYRMPLKIEPNNGVAMHITPLN